MPPETGVSDSRSFKPFLKFYFSKALGILKRRALWGKAINYVAEDAIIRGNEECRRCFQDYSLAVAAYAGVDDSHVNGLVGEITVGHVEKESSLKNVLWLDGVTDVYDISFGVGRNYCCR